MILPFFMGRMSSVVSRMDTRDVRREAFLDAFSWDRALFYVILCWDMRDGHADALVGGRYRLKRDLFCMRVSQRVGVVTTENRAGEGDV